MKFRVFDDSKSKLKQRRERKNRLVIIRKFTF
jgi:hypothetical protein